VAAAPGVPLAFEAAVAGGIPAIKALPRRAGGNDLRRVAAS
jgi:homoserine dehydrogenase